jgi:predicted aldo/keto reductase-like oxidoreductase
MKLIDENIKFNMPSNKQCAYAFVTDFVINFPIITNDLMMKYPNRRTFVKSVSLAAGASLLPLSSYAGLKPLNIPKRTLGRTGERISILTMGGYHVSAPNVPEEEGVRIIRKSIDGGINMMDNAWTYHDGRAETVMGKALKDGYREKVLLMTKFTARTLDEIKKQLEDSLSRFDLDRFDIMQFHAIGSKDDDVDNILNNKLIEWAEEQRSQGIFRYIGFTGHSDPKAHIKMIQTGYPWDTTQMPINIGDYHRNVSFEKDVLPLCLENNIGIFAMKSNGMGHLKNSGIATPVEGLRYTMSQPVSTVVSGIDSMDILDENMALFHNFTPLTDLERAEFLARSEGKSDQIEKYRRNLYDKDKNLING